MPRRRPAAFVPVVLACLCAGLLLFGPGLTSRPTDAPRTFAAASSVPVTPRPDAAPRVKNPRLPASANNRAATTAASPYPASSAPSDAVFTFAETPGSPRAFAVALDELYFPARPITRRLQTLPPAPDLVAHLARVATLAEADPTASVSAASVAPDALRHSPAPRLVLYPVGEPRNAATRRIVTPGLVVTLPSADASTPAPTPSLGIVAWERPAYAPAQAVARIAGDAAQPLRAAAALASAPGFESARPLLARELQPAHVPGAAFFRDQWHLRNTGQRGGTKGNDIRATPAWDLATGAGVTIGILDTYIDTWHRDLRDRVRADLARDWLDGGPDEDANHGTAVAGLAVAGGPHARTVGAAFDARFAALRLLGDSVTQEDIAEAFAWKNDDIDIKNNSWGPPAGPDELGAFDPLVFDALEHAVSAGRGGLGVLFVAGTGNGRKDGEQGSKSALASARQSLAIGAINRHGSVAGFSEDGPHLLAVAPGADVLTTDVTGDGGYITTADFPYEGDRELADYVFFTGTSAAAPVASGVCALLLQARPDLGWRDVKEILLRSSTQLSPADAGWSKRAGNRPGLPAIRHHARFGAGLLNAQAALRLAAAWPVLPPEEILVAPPPATPLPATIPDAPKKSPVKLVFVVPADAPPFRVEHVSLTLGITHPARGDLDIQLRSPSGVVSRFATATLADSGADYPRWTFTSVHHWGEHAAGAWTLTISDAYRDDVGMIDSADLVFHGISLLPPALSTTLSQPTDGTFTTGSSFLTQVNAEGLDLTYTWYRNDKKIASGRSPELHIKALTARDAGAYRCVVSNPWGSVATPDFVITIDDTPLATFATHVGVVQEIPLDAIIDVLGYDSPLKIASLPPGLRYDPATRTITGTMAKTGVWNTSFTVVYDGLAIRRYIRFESAAHYPDYAGSYIVPLYGNMPGFNRGLGGLVELLVREDGRFTGQLRLGAARHALSGTLRNSQYEGGIYVVLKLPALSSAPACKLAVYIDRGWVELSVGRPGDPEPSLFGDTSYSRSGNSPEPHETGRYLLALDGDAPLPGGVFDGYADLAATGRASWRLRDSAGKALHTGSIMLDGRGRLLLYDFTAKPAGEIVGSVNLLGDHLIPDSLSWNPANPTTSGHAPETRDVVVTPPEATSP